VGVSGSIKVFQAGYYSRLYFVDAVLALSAWTVLCVNKQKHINCSGSVFAGTFSCSFVLWLLLLSNYRTFTDHFLVLIRKISVYNITEHPFMLMFICLYVLRCFRKYTWGIKRIFNEFPLKTSKTVPEVFLPEPLIQFRTFTDHLRIFTELLWKSSGKKCCRNFPINVRKVF